MPRYDIEPDCEVALTALCSSVLRSEKTLQEFLKKEPSSHWNFCMGTYVDPSPGIQCSPTLPAALSGQMKHQNDRTS